MLIFFFGGVVVHLILVVKVFWFWERSPGGWRSGRAVRCRSERPQTETIVRKKRMTDRKWVAGFSKVPPFFWFSKSFKVQMSVDFDDFGDDFLCDFSWMVFGKSWFQVGRSWWSMMFNMNRGPSPCLSNGRSWPKRSRKPRKKMQKKPRIVFQLDCNVSWNLHTSKGL